jgi:hypothetical protein
MTNPEELTTRTAQPWRQRTDNKITYTPARTWGPMLDTAETRGRRAPPGGRGVPGGARKADRTGVGSRAPLTQE